MYASNPTTETYTQDYTDTSTVAQRDRRNVVWAQLFALCSQATDCSGPCTSLLHCFQKISMYTCASGLMLQAINRIRLLLNLHACLGFGILFLLEGERHLLHLEKLPSCLWNSQLNIDTLTAAIVLHLWHSEQFQSSKTAFLQLCLETRKEGQDFSSLKPLQHCCLLCYLACITTTATHYAESHSIWEIHIDFTENKEPLHACREKRKRKTTQLRKLLWTFTICCLQVLSPSNICFLSMWCMLYWGISCLRSTVLPYLS